MGHPPKIQGVPEAILVQIVEADPTATLEEIGGELFRRTGTQRQDPKTLATLPIPVPTGAAAAPGQTAYVPLGQLASIEVAPGPNQISRENGKRRIVITSNVRGHDLGSFVEELRERVGREIKLPEGYWVNYGGTFEQLISASQRLSVVVPAVLVLIFGLLFMAFGSGRDAAIVFSGVPLALTDGVAALWLRDIPLSISAGVGFMPFPVWRCSTAW
jgi:cobalt-zinc-cadmium resistance protein CzcA